MRIVMNYLEVLKSLDEEIYNISIREVSRQSLKIQLIPSENYASEAVYQASLSLFNNKYAEGYKDKRYYEGTQLVEELEELVISRAKSLFSMPNANVQAYSGSPANLAAYMALLEPGDKILGMHLPSGGHMTHGWKITASGRIFNPIFYGYAPDSGVFGIDPDTGLLDYSVIEEIARKEKPQLIIAGASSYPRTIDFESFGRIADSVGAILMADIAHINGLIVGGVHPSPAGHADVVTSTSHKLLRGPRGAFVLSSDRQIERNGKMAAIADLIDQAVFPRLQGGAHFSAVAALGVALKEASSDSFKKYARQVLANSRALAEKLMNSGFELVTGGTDNHLMVIDVHKSLGVSGKTLAKALDKAGIVCNFNTVPNDPRSATDPSGVRFGTPAITSRGFVEEDMEFIAQCVLSVSRDSSDGNLEKVRHEVAAFCSQDRLAIPGVTKDVFREVTTKKYWMVETQEDISRKVDAILSMLDEQIWYFETNDEVPVDRIREQQAAAIVIPEGQRIDLPSDAFVGVFKYCDSLQSRYRALVRAQDFVDNPMSNYALADNAEMLGERVVSACLT
jgi:glycine hydroxymethyltransferase